LLIATNCFDGLNQQQMSLVANAFFIEYVSRKLLVARSIGEFHDLIYGTMSSPKKLIYSSESISQSICASKPIEFKIFEL
jgi:hypothetical protein